MSHPYSSSIGRKNRLKKYLVFRQSLNLRNQGPLGDVVTWPLVQKMHILEPDMISGGICREIKECIGLWIVEDLLESPVEWLALFGIVFLPAAFQHVVCIDVR